MAAREGRALSTQAGNPKQAIAIGLSRARRAGVQLPALKKCATLESDAQAGGSAICYSSSF